jgi:hypothetical protein
MPQFNKFMLNPQPLPPRFGGSSLLSRVSLNPQPLPPRIIAVLIGL